MGKSGENSHTGGVRPRGKKFHILPFFVLKASLSNFWHKKALKEVLIYELLIKLKVEFEVEVVKLNCVSSLIGLILGPNNYGHLWTVVSCGLSENTG